MRSRAATLSSALAAVLLVAGMACHAGASAWPVAGGWRSETFTFPLEFAPGIAHRGTEEAHFPHGFLDASAPRFFSYAFVWWLDDDRPLDAASLAVDLVAYFDGLATAVDAERHKLPRERAHTTARLADESGGVRGEIVAWDPFTTGQPITLHVRMHGRTCGPRRVAVFELSPQAEEHPVWRELDAAVERVGCP